MHRNHCLSVLIALSLAGCHEEARPPQHVVDPNVPPSTPTVTEAVPGFDAPAAKSSNSSVAEVTAPSATMRPSSATPPPRPPTNPLAAKLGPNDFLHYMSFPSLAGVKAGTRVDLLGVFPIDGTNANAPAAKVGSESESRHEVPADQPQFVTMTLLQNARVVDVRSPSGGSVRAGVALTPDEVEMMLVSDRRGEIMPLVRSPSDVEVSTVRKVTLREVLEDLEIYQEKRQIRRRRAHASVGTGAIAPDERGLVLENPLPAGVLTVGSQVDVYGVFDLPNGGHVTMVLLQDVDIVSVGSDELQLSVTVEEAKALVLAERRGELKYVLRGRNHNVSTIAKKTLREVLEDLEVIQEKRLLRIRKKPRRKKAMNSIEIIAGDRGGAPPSVGIGAARSTHVAPPAANTESYDNPGQHTWMTTADDALSTFAADVDGGSFTITRRKLNEGVLPPADSVRPEEWVNYFTYNYPQPTDGPFGVSLEAAPSPFQTDTNYRLLRVGIQGKTFEAEERPPVHLTFLVDVSGSMHAEDKLGLVKRALKFLIGSLRPDDTVAITTYAGRTETLLHPTSASRRGEIVAAINQLNSGGGTAMDDGLEAAYALAQSSFVAGHENRVLVLSDGDANVGRTSVDGMLATIESGVDRGITMSTIGFGMGNYKDSAMEQLANKGDGNYFYIDSFDEARRVFGEQLDGTLRTIARDVKLQVEFDPTAVRRYRLIGYENRDIADEDFRNDSVDAGEIGAGHSVTALYELEMADPNAERIATVRIRHRNPDDSGPTLETTAMLRGIDMASKLADTSYSFRFAAAVAAFAEIMRDSPYAAHLNLDWVAEIASGALGKREERRELLELISAAKKVRLNL